MHGGGSRACKLSFCGYDSPSLGHYPMTRRHQPPVFPVKLLHILAVIAALPAAGSAEPLRYNRDIRPILSDNCFACHGPDKGQLKAGLRLDVREVALKPAKSGDIAIVPGKV